MVKLDISQAFPCRKDGRSGTDGYPSDDFHNKGHTRTPLHRGSPRAPTDPSNTINMNQNIMEAIKSVPIIFQVAYYVIFCLDIPAFTPSSPKGRGEPLYWIATSPPLRSALSLRLTPTKPPHQRPSRTVKEIQTAHDQWTVQP